MAQFELTWVAPEFEYHEKDVSWYWISIIIAAIIIAFSVWERNFLFGFFIVVAEVLIIMWGNKEPQAIAFGLDENNIVIGEHKHHLLKEFETWSTDDINDDYAELIFNFHASLRVPLRILVPEDHLEEIRKNLKPILREIEHQPTLLDSIEKLLRF